MTDVPPTQPLSGPILLCAGTDAATAGRLAEAAAALLIDRPVVVLATWAPPPIMGPFDGAMDALYDVHADQRAEARHVAGEAARGAAEALAGYGLGVTTRIRDDARAPWHAILEVADEIGAAVIVGGTREAGSPHPGTLGRQARGLAHRTHRPLLLLPPDATPADIRSPALFAFDGSASARHAVGTAARLMRPRPAVVATAWLTASYAVGVALIAVPEAVAERGADGLDERSRHDAEHEAGDGAQILTGAGWDCEAAALEGRLSVPATIVDVADDRDAAIVVTGTRGRSRIAAALLGSTAESVLRHAGRPVLLIPPPRAD